MCIRFYRRADGTLLLGDCAVGRGRTWRHRATVAAGLAALTLGATACMGMRRRPTPRVVTSEAAVRDGDATLRVTLRDRPAATLYVDGFEVPLGALVELEPGSHGVTIMANGAEWTREVRLDQRGVLELDVDLDKDWNRTMQTTHK
jgi:hypothetical protein